MLNLWTEALARYGANAVAGRDFPRSCGADRDGTGLVTWTRRGSVLSSVKCVLDQGFCQRPSWLPAPRPRWCLPVAMGRQGKVTGFFVTEKSLSGEFSGLDLKLVIPQFNVPCHTGACWHLPTVLSWLAGLGARAVTRRFSLSPEVVPATPFLVFLVLLHSFLPYGVCFPAP